jgi:hypothetical protein
MTYEHRRQAYVDFLVRADNRAAHILDELSKGNEQPSSLGLGSVGDALQRIDILGGRQAAQAAHRVDRVLSDWGSWRIGADSFDEYDAAMDQVREAIRRDLAVPDWANRSSTTGRCSWSGCGPSRLPFKPVPDVSQTGQQWASTNCGAGLPEIPLLKLTDRGGGIP